MLKEIHCNECGNHWFERDKSARKNVGLSELLCAKLDKWIDQCNENFRLLKDQGLTDLAAAHNAMAQAYWNVKQFIIENGA